MTSLRDEIINTRANYDFNESTDKLVELFDKAMLECADTPIRTGDRLPSDEIIPDGAREALVRAVIKERVKEITK